MLAQAATQSEVRDEDWTTQVGLLLWPANFSLAYVGYTVFNPFVAVRRKKNLDLE